VVYDRCHDTMSYTLCCALCLARHVCKHDMQAPERTGMTAWQHIHRYPGAGSGATVGAAHSTEAMTDILSEVFICVCCRSLQQYLFAHLAFWNVCGHTLKGHFDGIAFAPCTGSGAGNTTVLPLHLVQALARAILRPA